MIVAIPLIMVFAIFNVVFVLLPRLLFARVLTGTAAQTAQDASQRAAQAKSDLIREMPGLLRGLVRMMADAARAAHEEHAGGHVWGDDHGIVTGSTRHQRCCPTGG